MASIVLIRGGGDLASGVALRLIRAGIKVVITELPEPLAIRRTVAFAEAIYEGQVTIEGIEARFISDADNTSRIFYELSKGIIPVLVDPDCTIAPTLNPAAIVDGRMTKTAPVPIDYVPMLYIGLGPGFIAGENCQALVETRRSHSMGRVFWQGIAQPDSCLPEGDPRRVLRAPAAGTLTAHSQIGDRLEAGQLIAEVSGHKIPAPFKGVLRGLIRPGLAVTPNMKIGDIDNRNDPNLCWIISDKALAVGGGVLEALLSRPELRQILWS